MLVLKAENLRKIYGKGENQVKALDGVELSVEKGEFVAVVGTSGSGKSTLLNMLGGLDTPTEGSIRIGNTEACKAYQRGSHRFQKETNRFHLPEL